MGPMGFLGACRVYLNLHGLEGFGGLAVAAEVNEIEEPMQPRGCMCLNSVYFSLN